MPPRKTMKQAAAESHGAAGAVAGGIRPNLGKNGLHLVPPPESSSEATGAPEFAPFDAPPVQAVAERIRKLATGEEKIEAPAESSLPENPTEDVPEPLEGAEQDRSEAYLLGREMAIGGEILSACPMDLSEADREEWIKGWAQARREIDAPPPNGLDVTIGEGGVVTGVERSERTSSFAPSDEAPNEEAKQHPPGYFDLFHGIPSDTQFEDADEDYIESRTLAVIGEGLIDRHGDFRRLRGKDIRYYWRRNGGAPSNKVQLGAAHHPVGLLRQSLENADWIIWLAADHLRTAKPTARQVEACVFHQLCHAQETSKGKPTNAPHDFEGYKSELTHYGPWNTELVELLNSLNRKPGPEVEQMGLDLNAAGDAEDVGDIDAQAEDDQTADGADSANEAELAGVEV